MTRPVRSLNYESHASIKGPLTNRQIDIYCCRGAYGRDRQDAILLAIEEGRFKSLDSLIRKGEVCIEAQQALNRRKVVPRKRKVNITNNSFQDLLKALEVGHF